MTMREKALALLAGEQTAPEFADLALDLSRDVLRLSFIMSDPDWGVGMLEDVAEIVGTDSNPDAEPRWERH